MILEKSDRFNDELEEIVHYNALDNPNRALQFFDDLISTIENIPLQPFSHRKRKSNNDKTIRELIFKGYTIPYYMDTNKNRIIILGIFNQNIWKA